MKFLLTKRSYSSLARIFNYYNQLFQYKNSGFILNDERSTNLFLYEKNPSEHYSDKNKRFV